MPNYLEMTADKFTFRVATDRLYSPAGVAEMESQVSEMYRTRLPGIYQKIKP